MKAVRSGVVVVRMVVGRGCVWGVGVGSGGFQGGSVVGCVFVGTGCVCASPVGGFLFLIYGA